MSELREEIREMLGVETAPNGKPDYFLIRDINGKVTEGIDFSEEVDGILAVVEREKAASYEEGLADIDERPYEQGFKAGAEAAIAKAMKRPTEPLEYSESNWRNWDEYQEDVQEYRMRLQAYWNAMYLMSIVPLNERE